MAPMSVNFKEEKDMMNQQNYAQKKAMANEMFIVGRGENIAFYTVDKNNVANVKIGKFDVAGRPLQATTTWLVAKAIESNVKANKGLLVHTLGSVAILYRTVLKHMNAFMNAEDTTKEILSTTYYVDALEDDEDMLAQKDASRKATTEFVKQVFAMKNSGLFLEVANVSDFNKINLVVPKDTELEDGQKIDFVNGKDCEGLGIAVQGWDSFKRNGAIIHERQEANGNKSYFLFKEEALRGVTYTKTKAIQKLWDECPETMVEPEIEVEEVSFDLTDF